jgi:hypothetical protein
MFVSIGSNGGRRLIGTAWVVIAAGCSPGAERAADRDTTSGVSTGAAAADTGSPTTAPRTESAAVAPTSPKPRVRPSIDPGRKKTTPAPAPATPSDSAGPTPPAGAADSSAQAPGTTGQDPNLKFDAKSNTVTFQLIGGPSGFQFNGHSSGSATLTLPPNANVVMNFINKDGTPHSAEVISGEGSLPNSGGDAAIPRAYTNQLIQGLPQEGTDVMKFTAPASGTYRIFCGVPGHGLSGMWIWMKIDPSAKTPSFGPTKG